MKSGHGMYLYLFNYVIIKKKNLVNNEKDDDGVVHG